MAVAPNGDLYVADPYLTFIVKIPVGGGPWSEVGSGFNQPRSVAVDKAGNVYVMDTVNHRVVKVAADGTQKQLSSGVLFGTDILVDGAGNVYYLDVQQQVVFKILASGAGPYWYWGGIPFPGLGMDRAGNLYFYNSQQRISKLTPNLVSSQLTGQLVSFLGLTADATGNVYYFGASGINLVPAGSAPGTVVHIPDTPYTTAAAVDTVGDLLFVRQNSPAIESQPTTTTLGATGVCADNSPTCARNVQLNFKLNFATYASAAYVVDEGVKNPSLDFRIANTTCKGILYAGTTCSVTVGFSPRSAGLHRGSVAIIDTYGAVLGESSISGIGIGPQIAFGPGVQTTVASGVPYAAGVAVDPAGNLYIS
jgi:hypothetical protein